MPVLHRSKKLISVLKSPNLYWVESLQATKRWFFLKEELLTVILLLADLKYNITNDDVMNFRCGFLLEHPKETLQHVLVRVWFAIANVFRMLNRNFLYAYNHMQSVPVKRSYLAFRTMPRSITRYVLFRPLCGKCNCASIWWTYVWICKIYVIAFVIIQ